MKYVTKILAALFGVVSIYWLANKKEIVFLTWFWWYILVALMLARLISEIIYRYKLKQSKILPEQKTEIIMPYTLGLVFIALFLLFGINNVCSYNYPKRNYPAIISQKLYSRGGAEMYVKQIGTQERHRLKYPMNTNPQDFKVGDTVAITKQRGFWGLEMVYLFE